jgi:hypothetical protein
MEGKDNESEEKPQKNLQDSCVRSSNRTCDSTKLR